MVFKNIVLKVHLTILKKKINFLIKAKTSFPLQNSLLVSLTINLFLISQKLNYSENDLIYKLKEQDFFKQYKLLVHDKELLDLVSNNWQNKNFWTDKLPEVIKNKTKDFNQRLTNLIRSIKHEEKLDLFIKVFDLNYLVYLIDGYIDQFKEKNIGLNKYRENYQENLDLFLIELDWIKKLQTLIHEQSPIDFNQQFIAINLMLKPKH
ncbi:MAG: hypothetical protein L3I91_00295 [Mycoplasma sp.]